MPLARIKWTTPIEIQTREKPDLTDLKVFGCAAYVFLPPEKRKDKLAPQSELMTLIGSPHHLNSEFAFYTHSKQYPNVTTHFRILFHIFTAYFTSSQLIRTSEAHFGNFGPISDLRSLFRKLRTYKTCIPTFGYLRTTHPDHKYDL
jgi:hypothetical protein